MNDIQHKVDVVTEFSVTNLLRHPKMLESKDDCYYICDLSEVLEKHKLWRKVFPRIRSHYAVKCIPDKVVLRMMIAMGLGFDCASRQEIQLMLSLGARPEDIIFSHPYKQASHLSYAAEHNVKRSVFDTKEELDKTNKCFPNAQLVLRIKTLDLEAQFPLSGKFGASLKDCPQLIDYARELGLNVVGVSFHVGSNQRNCSAYVRALRDARSVFNYAESAGFHFTLLDIGGGFPGSYKSELTVEKIAVTTNEGLETHFPVKDFPDLQIISEPGRYYVTSAFNLITTVIGKRVVSTEGNDQAELYNYHINEGCFGGLNVVLWEKPDYFPINKLDENLEKHLTNIWGPTRTNSDAVKTRILLPELEVGDRILWTNMGGYSTSIQTSFCDVKVPPIKYVIPINSLCEILKMAFSS